MKAKICLVEDDLDLLEALTATLDVEGIDYIAFDSAAEALTILERVPVDLVVSDINMPNMDGFQFLAAVRKQHPGLPVMLMTAYGQISQAVSALQNGAADYLVKPFNATHFIEAIGRYTNKSTPAVVNGPIAADAASKRTFELAARVAKTDSTVLISGESGTGKEVLARYIHEQSPRKSGPFVAINCAAIPENMLEAILFGYEKGAFTGAMNSMPGKFEQAEGGTLLLDEITEMDLGLQSKLLRVLQEREVERLGSRKTIKLDVRVVATTNRDLKKSVAAGSFREDLFYRLSVFPVHWLPLRERRGDILPLAKHLLGMHSSKMKLNGVQFSEAARSALQAYNWPGNIREMDNIIQRALIMQQNGLISSADLCLDSMTSSFVSDDHTVAELDDNAGYEDNFDETRGEGPDLGQEVRQREYQVILETLRNESGRRNRVAEKLGISPRTLRYKIAKMRESGIDIDACLAAG
ncbi:sigma-54 dependent transcriptional regulator [Allohahella marinimesophila]|uniref:Sigma-54-dependent response regulator transcription factor FleR n=1 Tax=Allohahella marinimesophila TaxID=1054972 RepID=A0ABP7PPZ1_9GAMM